MQLLTVAGWLTLNNACQALKISRHLPVSHAMFVNAEKLLTQTENRIVNGQVEVDCQVPVMPVAWVVKRYLTARQMSGACSGVVGKNIYHYRIETLAVDPCVQPGGSGNVGKYVRLTLALRSPVWDASLILQSVILKAGSTAETCSGRIRSLQPGRISWRQVDNEI